MSKLHQHTSAPSSRAQGAGPRLGLVMVVHLAGLLIGGLYVGMVSPVRTVIQADFGIDDATGIWIINIYTLFYAALIPVIGKAADRLGRNRVFTFCLCVFSASCALCGLAQTVGGLPLLLVGRVLQAAGAGGMIPVANAEIGTSFPPEKRGMALGIAAAVMGVANVFGSACGSALVGLFGTQNWSAVFYVGVPFGFLVAVLAKLWLPRSAMGKPRGKMDIAGSLLLVMFVLLLLLGIKGIDFTAFAQTVSSPSVWGALAGAIVVALVFRFVEQRAEDPVFHLEYFHSRPILVTMIVSFFIGCFIISMVMVPQLVEYAMNDPLGSGGYYVLAIGLTSFVTTPIAGKLIDRIGPKRVLITGLAVSIAGLLFLAFVVMAAPSAPMLVAGLAVVGAGMGMSMGSPTNYMILENTGKEESTAAVATITLVRQIGTSVAPALFVGLIASAPGMAGYQYMLLSVVVVSALALVTMLFYRSPERG